jgi:hypothetical protein
MDEVQSNHDEAKQGWCCWICVQCMLCHFFLNVLDLVSLLCFIYLYCIRLYFFCQTLIARKVAKVLIALSYAGFVFLS